MKVGKKLFFIALMIWMIFIVNVYAAIGTVKKYDAIVLREGPTTSSDPLAEIHKGETLEIIDKTDNWYKVNYDGKTGYVREDLISVEETSEEPTETETAEEQETSEEPAEEANPEEPVEEPNENAEKTSEGTSPEETPNPEKVLNPIGEKKVTADTVSRIVPSMSASKLEDVKAGTTVTVIKVMNLWSCIKYDNNKTAWILTSFLGELDEESAAEETSGSTEYTARTGYINVSAARIRKGPSTSSDTITEKYRNNPVNIIGEDGDWYKISLDGEEAYIAKRLVSDSVTTESTSRNLVDRSAQEAQEALERSLEKAQEEAKQEQETQAQTTQVEETKKQEETKAAEEVKTVVIETPKAEEPKVETPAPAASSRGEEVVALAKQYLGCSYTYGGSGPSTFDCSGFTMYIFSKFGISLAHGAISQSNAGTYVSKDNLQPGDLVIFRDWNNTSIGHCGIYIGDGRFIHAANPSRGVVTDTLNSGYYYERYVSARRLV